MPETVSQPPEMEPDPEMSAIGYLVAAGSLLALIPVLPVVAVLWAYDRLTGGGSRSGSGDSEPRRGNPS